MTGKQDTRPRYVGFDIDNDRRARAAAERADARYREASTALLAVITGALGLVVAMVVLAQVGLLAAGR